MSDQTIVNDMLATAIASSQEKAVRAIKGLLILSQHEVHCQTMTSMNAATVCSQLVLSRDATRIALGADLACACARSVNFCSQFIETGVFEKLINSERLEATIAQALLYLGALVSQHASLHERLSSSEFIRCLRYLHGFCRAGVHWNGLFMTALANICASSSCHSMILNAPLVNYMSDMIRVDAQDPDTQPFMEDVLRCYHNLVSNEVTRSGPMFKSLFDLLKEATLSLNPQAQKYLLQILKTVSHSYSLNISINWMLDSLRHFQTDPTSPELQLLATTCLANVAFYIGLHSTSNSSAEEISKNDEFLIQNLTTGKPSAMTLNILRLIANMSYINQGSIALRQLMAVGAKAILASSTGSWITQNTAAQFYVVYAISFWHRHSGRGGWTLPEDLDPNKVTEFCQTYTSQQQTCLLMDTHMDGVAEDMISTKQDTSTLLQKCLNASSNLRSIADPIAHLYTHLRYTTDTLPPSQAPGVLQLLGDLGGLYPGSGSSDTLSSWSALTAYTSECIRMMVERSQALCETITSMGGGDLLLSLLHTNQALTLKSRISKSLLQLSYAQSSRKSLATGNTFQILGTTIRELLQALQAHPNVPFPRSILPNILLLLANITLGGAGPSPKLQSQLTGVLVRIIDSLQEPHPCLTSYDALTIQALALRALSNLVTNPLKTGSCSLTLSPNLIPVMTHLMLNGPAPFSLEAMRAFAIFSIDHSSHTLLCTPSLLSVMMTIFTEASQVLQAFACAARETARLEWIMRYDPLPVGSEAHTQKWSRDAALAVMGSPGPNGRSTYLDGMGPADVVVNMQPPGQDLQHLAGSPDEAEYISTRHGSIKSVYQKAEALKYALVAVANFCCQDALEDMVLSSGISTKILRMLGDLLEDQTTNAQDRPSMGANTCDSHLCRWLTLALTNMTNTKKTQSLFERQEAVDTLVKVLQTTTDAIVVVNTLTIVSNLCLHPGPAEVVARHPSGLYAILNYSVHPKLEIRRRALQCVANFSAHDFSPKYLIQHDTIDTMQEIVFKWKEDTYSHVYVAGYLCNVAGTELSGHFVNRSGIDILLQLTGSPSPLVQAAVAHAFSRLTEVPQYRKAIADAGGVQCLLSLARSSDQETQARAASALAIFTEAAMQQKCEPEPEAAPTRKKSDDGCVVS